jgi:hypothetical protein
MQADTNSQEKESIVKWFESLVLVPDGYPVGFSLAPGGSPRPTKLNDLTDPPRPLSNDPDAPPPAPRASDAPRVDYIK